MENYSGKNVLLTGFSGAIGYSLALELCRSGAHLIATDKTEGLCDKTKERLLKDFSFADVTVVPCDFLGLNNVKSLAQNVIQKLNGQPLDFLINAAGIYSKWQKLTDEANEMQFQINYLAPYTLTCLLISELDKSQSGRVVFLTTPFFYKTFNRKYFLLEKFGPLRMYALSKSCLKIFAGSVNSRPSNTTHAVNVKIRMTDTNLFTENNTGLFKQTVEKLKKHFVDPSLSAMDIAEDIKTSVNSEKFLFKGRKAVKPRQASEKTLLVQKDLAEYSKSLTGVELN